MVAQNGSNLAIGFSFEVDEAPTTLLAAWTLLLRRSTRADFVPIHLLHQNNILLANLEIPENITFNEYTKRVSDGASKAKCLNKIDASEVLKGLRGEKSITTPNFTVGYSTNEFSKKGCELELRIGSIQAEVLYCPNTLESDAIQMLGERFIALIDSVKQFPNVDVGQLSMMNIDQETTILSEWNDTYHPWPENYCIHHLFFEQVERNPYRTALIFGNQTYTYNELAAKIRELAQCLMAFGVQAEVPVALLMDRCPETVIAIYAILEAGGFYIPLDPSWPQSRQLDILKDANINHLITMKSMKEKPPSEFIGRVICADYLPFYVASEGVRGVPATFKSPVYALYTSGTTGKPKGVIVEHRGLVKRIQWLQDKFSLNSHDRVLNKTPCVFGISEWEFFWALPHGSTLVVAPSQGHKDPSCMQELILDRKITTAFFVPSMLAMLLDHLELSGQISSLQTMKYMFTCGEALGPKLCKRFAKMTQSRLVNLYGPTEADMTWWEYPRNENNVAKVPIGKPMTNVKVYILDDHLKPVPIGVPGELCFGGVAVARGYINRPEITAKCFVTNPFSSGRMYRTGDLVQWMPDGNIEFLGRIDFQIKLRGYRIELAEIESVLMNKCDGVKAVVVMLRGKNPEEHHLAAYLQPADLKQEAIIKECERHLPKYMVPTRMMFMDNFPLNERQKVDRSKFPEIKIQQPATLTTECPPTTKTEEVIEKVWNEVLRYGAHLKINIDSDFEHLGGSSLLAGYAITKLRLAFNRLPISGTAIYIHSTIRKLGKFIDELKEKHKFTDVPLDKNGSNGVGNCKKEKQWQGKSPTSFLAFIWQLIVIIVEIPIGMIPMILAYYFYYFLPQIKGDDVGTSFIDRLVIGGKLGFLLIPLIICIEIIEVFGLGLFALVTKGILIGKIQEGRHRVYGSFYWRWLIVKNISQVATNKVLQLFGGTFLYNVWIKCLGGTIGSRASIDSVIFTPELVSIGNDTMIDEHSTIDPSTVANGELIFERIKIGSRCIVMPTAFVTPGTVVRDDTVVGVMSTTTKDSKSVNLKPNLSPGALRGRFGLRICFGVPLLLIMRAFPVFILSITSMNLECVLQSLFPSSNVSTYIYMLLLPHVSWLTFTESFFSIVVLFKKMIIGKFRSGVRSKSAWNDFRYWMMRRIKNDPMFHQAMSPWNSCELLSIKYRLLGAKIGSRVNIDFFEIVEYDLLSVGDDCVFGSGVKIYASDELEAIPITLANNANVLDHSVLLPGVKVGKEAITGTYTIGPKNHHFPDFSVSTGCQNGEPILLRKRLGDIAGKNSGLPEDERQMVLQARSRHKSTCCWLFFNLWVILCVIVWMPMANFFYLGVVLYWYFTPLSLFWSFMITPLLFHVCDLAHVLVVLAVKWILVGKYKKGNYPYYGLLHYKWTLMMVVHASINGVLVAIEGTFLMNLFHRAMGTYVGKNVCILGHSSYEADLMMLEDEVTIDRGGIISSHTVENMVLKLAPVYYHKGCSTRSNAVLMPGGAMEPYSTLLEESQVLKGETVPAGQVWAGLPAEPISTVATNQSSNFIIDIKDTPKSNRGGKKAI